MVGLTASNCRFWAQPLLGCNVYISAGGLRRHQKVLNDLLKGTQDHCSTLMNNDGSTSSKSTQSPNSDVCVVVHAFSDRVYNRSSFHLAGTEKFLPVIVSTLVSDAKQKLGAQLIAADQVVDSPTGKEEEYSSTSHPYVGLVDHISVMPLLEESESDHDDLHERVVSSNHGRIDEDNDGFLPTTACGRVAREIGKTMAKTLDDVNVFYYGDAHPNQTSLADVRRQKTSFFHSGGLTTQKRVVGKEKDIETSNHKHNNILKETATVGAPATFVENYNIRLTSKCNKKTAQSLTRFVRERDGGLVGVEALTLPYSNGRYEVACNLTQPMVGGSAKAIDQKVEEWVSDQIIRRRTRKEQEHKDDDNDDAIIDVSFFVEKSYRVGSTSKQCLEVLQLVTTNCANDDDDNNNNNNNNNNALEEHNLKVQLQLANYLSSA